MDEEESADLFDLLSQITGGRLAEDCEINRIHAHFKYVSWYEKEKGKLKHFNEVHNFPVMTKQEIQICFQELCAVE
ncbi:MAG: hypothetical protein K9K79_01845 [Desulfohalobiaceae bacterium]|nr:hypothetical protein [Desulfohalobiaceae bacterium]